VFQRLLIVAIVFTIQLLPLVASDAGAKERRCAQCNELIDGGHFETQGEYYHPEHFRCQHCDNPIKGAYTEYKGANYHTRCFQNQIALRCSLCGDIIAGEYILDYWGNSYHLDHQGEAPCCDSCSRFISSDITGGGVRYDDGRYICAICHPTSVTDIDDILAMIDEVARHLDDMGMDVDYKGLLVHLVGREQMKDIAGEHSNALRGFTDYSEDWRLFGKPKGRKINVYLLYGMPRTELLSTITHELVHIWQFNHGRFENDRALSEGSCNFAAFMVLGQYPGQQSSFFRNSLMKDEDAIYGDGFRRVKELAEDTSTRHWIKYIRRNDTFPEGY